MEISMFLDDDYAGKTNSGYLENEFIPSKEHFSSSGCLGIFHSNLESSPPLVTVQRREQLLQTRISWNQTDQLDSCDQFDLSASSPFRVGASSFWSPPTGLPPIRAESMSSTVNPLATLKSGSEIQSHYDVKPPRRTSKGADDVCAADSVSPQLLTGKWPPGSTSDSSLNFTSLLGLPAAQVHYRTLQTPSKAGSQFNTSLTTVSSPSLIPPDRSPLSGTAPESPEPDSPHRSLSSQRNSARPQKQHVSTYHGEYHYTDSSEADTDSDLEDYLPSGPPSADRPSEFGFLKSTNLKRVTPAKKKPYQPKGSAALALAVVTQLEEAKKTPATDLGSDFENDDDEDYDPVRIYNESGPNASIRKKRNQSIPLPVPIPNLNKRSRGRKVPSVPNPERVVAAAFGRDAANHSMVKIKAQHDSDDDFNSGNERKKKKTTPTSCGSVNGLQRSFMCVVNGCGKCFVRGEHLKRHVRSIHTHEKPHACPYDGCDKSFSRRDNLGQHVRVHLSP